MSVYVDKVQIKFRRMKMCHMLADTLPELYAMAYKLNLSLSWLQKNPVVHFDICKAKRRLAIKYGAIEISRRDVAFLIRKIKQNK